MSVVYYGVNSEIYTDGSTRNEIHVALNISAIGLSNVFSRFARRLKELFYARTHLINPIYTGTNENVYAFDWKGDKLAVMTLFIKEDEQNIRFKNNFIPDLLKQEQEFFRAFRKNLREFVIR